MGMQHVIHREPDGMERLLAVLGGQQVIDVSDTDLRRITGIDRSTARSGAIQFRCRVVGVDDVFRLEPETREIGVEKRRIRIGVQQARNTNSKFGTFCHQSRTILRSLRNKESFGRRYRISDHLHLARAEDIMGRNIDKVWIRRLHFVDIRLDVLHLVQVFNRPFLTCSDNEALLTHAQRNLRLPWLELNWLGQFDNACGTWSELNLDKWLNLRLERRRCMGAASSTGGA